MGATPSERVAAMLRNRGVQVDAAAIDASVRSQAGRRRSTPPPPATGPATRGDARLVAGLLAGAGVRVDPERLLDRVEADRDRARADGQAIIARLQGTVSALRTAKRRYDLDMWDLRRRPCAETRAAATASSAAYHELVEELRERCVGDDALMADVLARR